MNEDIKPITLVEKMTGVTAKHLSLVEFDQLQLERHQNKYALLVKQLTKEGTDVTKMELGELILAYTELSHIMQNSLASHAAAVTESHEQNEKLTAALRAEHEQSKEH